MQVAIDALRNKIKHIQGELATAVIASKTYEEHAREARRKEGEAQDKIAELEAALVQLGAAPSPPHASSARDDDWREC
ncbi:MULTISPECIES: hypothetical protein [unclassified Agrobacterium]|uniref:hypothetical protein n=1 Tax=unclassified Agrobacterium TaxID=2632611 RepID=UPI0010083DDE|nr:MULTISPECIES: hypothetical protein [unclassified Agrobacterium]QKW95848.1 hypothetical protein GSF67_01275 [Agrobacterium sp. CGMCC 11546]